MSVQIVTKPRHKVKAKQNRKKCNFHNQLTISPPPAYPSTEHWHSWVIFFIFDIRKALESLNLNGSSKKVQISLSMETVK